MLIICMYIELTEANSTYSEKVQQHRNREKDLVSLAWKIKELSELNENGRALHTAISAIVTKLTWQCRWIEDNIPSKLKEI